MDQCQIEYMPRLYISWTKNIWYFFPKNIPLQKWPEDERDVHYTSGFHCAQFSADLLGLLCTNAQNNHPTLYNKTATLLILSLCVSQTTLPILVIENLHITVWTANKFCIKVHPDDTNYVFYKTSSISGRQSRRTPFKFSKYSLTSLNVSKSLI